MAVSKLETLPSEGRVPWQRGIPGTKGRLVLFIFVSRGMPSMLERTPTKLKGEVKDWGSSPCGLFLPYPNIFGQCVARSKRQIPVCRSGWMPLGQNIPRISIIFYTCFMCIFTAEDSICWHSQILLFYLNRLSAKKRWHVFFVFFKTIVRTCFYRNKLTNFDSGICLKSHVHTQRQQ